MYMNVYGSYIHTGLLISRRNLHIRALYSGLSPHVHRQYERPIFFLVFLPVEYSNAERWIYTHAYHT